MPRITNVLFLQEVPKDNWVIIHLFLCSFDQMSYEALKFSRRTNKISSFAWMWNMRWNNRILYISFAMMSRFIEQHQWQITGHIDDNIEAVIKWKWQKFGLKREQLAHSANKVSTMEVPDIRRRMEVILYCVRQFWDTNKAERSGLLTFCNKWACSNRSITIPDHSVFTEKSCISTWHSVDPMSGKTRTHVLSP